MGRATIYQALKDDLIALKATYIPPAAEATDTSAAGGPPKKPGVR